MNKALQILKIVLFSISVAFFFLLGVLSLHAGLKQPDHISEFIIAVIAFAICLLSWKGLRRGCNRYKNPDQDFSNSSSEQSKLSSAATTTATVLLRVVGGVVSFFALLWAVIYFGAILMPEEQPKANKKETAKIKRAIALCEQQAKNSAVHPSTVDFSQVMGLSTKRHENGRITVLSSFTAKNSFNLELKYDIRCLIGDGKIIDSSISESQ